MKEWSRSQYVKSLRTAQSTNFSKPDTNLSGFGLLRSFCHANRQKRKNRCLGLKRIVPMHHPNAQFWELDAGLESIQLGPL
jgi:hypothetical protein